MDSRGYERLKVINDELRSAIETLSEKLGKERQERHRLEEQMTHYRTEACVCFEHSRSMFFLVDSEMSILRANPSAHEFIGLPPGNLDGMSICSALSCIRGPAEQQKENSCVDCAICSLRQKLFEEKLPSVTEKMRVSLLRTGTPITGDLSLSAIRIKDDCGEGALICFDLNTDITEEPTNEMMNHIECLGELSGGFAHDVNNILTIVLGNVAIARLTTTQSTQVSDYLNKVEEAALKAADLTNHLLTFSRGGAPVKSVIDLEVTLRSALAEIAVTTKTHFVVEMEEDTRPIEADPDQLGQALRDIFENACQAMEDEGTVRIVVKELEIGENHPLMLRHGSYVLITVKDEGCGIPTTCQERILEPFFSTHDGSHGLGLPAAFSIIKRHGGHLELESNPGEGTTVRMFLPQAEGMPAAIQVPRAEGTTAPGLSTPRIQTEVPQLIREPGKPRTVLLMDDDEGLLYCTSELLQLIGWQVECASDGEEAVTKYGKALKAGDKFDAVILDLTVIGGMGGREAAQGILELDPQARTIVSSGYHNDPIMACFWEYGFLGCLAKPYDLCDMKSLLDALVPEEVVVES